MKKPTRVIIIILITTAITACQSGHQDSDQKNNEMQNISKMETIKSKDGTLIAYDRTGSGPPLVLVHGGAASNRKRWDIGGVRAALDDNYTVYAVDRRGRGGSGDHDEYSLEREYEDVAAVVNSINEPVTLLGHSLGANISLEAALLTNNIRRLILYEPAFATDDDVLVSEKLVTRVQNLIDKGEKEQALILFMREVALLSQEETDIFRKDPGWQSRLEAAHTLAREEKAFSEYRFDAGRFSDLSIPTLLLTGSESSSIYKKSTKAVHNALPNSRIVTLDGQAHIAMNTAPNLFIESVISFIK
jgi:pimeloyl-ACP methyl ester carboxylesterase